MQAELPTAAVATSKSNKDPYPGAVARFALVTLMILGWGSGQLHLRHSALRAVAAAMLCASFPTTAQSTSALDRVEIEASRINEAALAAAEAIQVTDDELMEEQRLDDLIVRNSMRQLANDPNSTLGETLPQPTSVRISSMSVALSYPTAWRMYGAQRANDETLKSAFQNYLWVAPKLQADERACRTGADAGVGRQLVDLLAKTLTKYPERLALRFFIQERDRLGYPDNPQCDRENLSTSQFRYQERLARLLDELALP